MKLTFDLILGLRSYGLVCSQGTAPLSVCQLNRAHGHEVEPALY